MNPGQMAMALAAKNAAGTPRPSARARKNTAGIATVASTAIVSPGEP